jgi:hypothetical protein
MDQWIWRGQSKRSASSGHQQGFLPIVRKGGGRRSSGRSRQTSLQPEGGRDDSQTGVAARRALLGPGMRSGSAGGWPPGVVGRAGMAMGSEEAGDDGRPATNEGRQLPLARPDRQPSPRSPSPSLPRYGPLQGATSQWQLLSTLLALTLRCRANVFLRIDGCSSSSSSLRRSRSRPRSRSRLKPAPPAVAAATATPPPPAARALDHKAKAKASARRLLAEFRSGGEGMRPALPMPRARSSRRTRTTRRRPTRTTQSRSSILRTPSCSRRRQPGQASRGCLARRQFMRR